MGSISTLFIAASTTGNSSLIIFSADDTTPILVLMFLSTISAIWSKFIIFIFFIVVTLSSTVLGLERSIISMPFLRDSIASFTLSYVTRKYGAMVATKRTSIDLKFDMASSNFIGFPPTVWANA